MVHFYEITDYCTSCTKLVYGLQTEVAVVSYLVSAVVRYPVSAVGSYPVSAVVSYLVSAVVCYPESAAVIS